MARLQILELPEGAGDDRPPFVLVIDQCQGVTLELVEAIEAHWKRVGEDIGAQGTLIFMETVDIPANDVPLDANGQPLFRAQVEEEINHALGRVTRALNAQSLADQRTEIACDADRLAKWKNELTDALGIDRTHNWDDIRNAATGIRKDRDAQAEAIERVRNLHRPVEHRGQTICWECSAYDFPSQSTDNAPVAHDQCGTLRAIAPDQPAPDA